jgi:hypothetical protein
MPERNCSGSCSRLCGHIWWAGPRKGSDLGVGHAARMVLRRVQGFIAVRGHAPRGRACGVTRSPPRSAWWFVQGFIAVRGGRGAPPPVLVGAACVLGWWAGWRRVCRVGGHGGGVCAGLVGTVAGCTLAGRHAWCLLAACGGGQPGGVRRLRVSRRVCVGGRAEWWSVRGALCLVLCLCRLVLVYGLLCCSGWLFLCLGSVAPVSRAFACFCLPLLRSCARLSLV